MATSRVDISRRDMLIRTGTILPAMHFGLFADASAFAAGNAEEPLKFRLKQLSLKAPNLSAQKEFYGKTLQLPVIDEDDSGVTIQAGATRLRFLPTEGKDAPFYHFAFNIPENMLERAIEWMKGRATILTWYKTGKQIVHFKQWNAHAVYFFDPAGNILEFIAHHSLDNASDGSFSVEDILYISEIGLVADSVPKLVAELDEKLSAKPYQGYSPFFAAVGDPHGFFICVKSNRIWLPTKDRAAQPFPAEVTIDSATGDGTIECATSPGARITFGS